ncbi:nucleoside transporter 2, putative [Plasmodium relictum]|uniref:Nucleoside transporter 2, putative n=1 Tax=Plasmodium relictum TaxID=85471 RepID=A0A1J1HDU4_PLARL|nr:nucleoside transporter 2, putative [Plasmodium relictum]CRH03709.1 nucleoside transporter 2, putative [Plasmodium relictum]
MNILNIIGNDIEVHKKCNIGNENEENQLSKKNEEQQLSKKNKEQQLSKKNKEHQLSKKNEEQQLSKENKEQQLSKNNKEQRLSKKNEEQQLSKKNEEQQLSKKNEEQQLSKKNEESMFGKKCKETELIEEKDEIKEEKNMYQKYSKTNDNVIFSNITLCLMGISSVLLYYYVLNTTPHIHALLNKDIMISFTFFLYFFVLVIVSLISSLFLEVKIIIYDICFILSFILQLIYPYIVKYYYHKTFFFYFLISCIGAICSFLKTMIFSIASIVLNSSKIVCLSYGITGIYCFFLTSLFYYSIIKVDEDIQKLHLSLFITSSINCTFILCTFICYSFLKRTENFKRKFSIYIEERKRRESESCYYEKSEQKTLDTSYFVTINMTQENIDNKDQECALIKNGNISKEKKKNEEKENSCNADNQIKEKFILKNIPFNISINDNENNIVPVPTKKNFLNKFFSYKMLLKNFLKQAKLKIYLYKKAFNSLFCVFYNIFLKIIVFPVACPELWTKNVDERYILIGIVQIADCVSRIFPTIAQSFPIFNFFLLSQKKILLYSFARTFLSLLCLIIPFAKIYIFRNFIFKCLLIFTNVYLNGWFIILSFINIPDVLRSDNSLSNVAIVSSFGSTLLRVGLLIGYGASTIYKYFFTRYLIFI